MAQEKRNTKGNFLLREWLKKRQLTQTDLAAMLWTSKPVVNRWMLGKVRPQIETAARIEKLTKGYVPASAWAKSLTTMKQVEKVQNASEKKNRKNNDTE